MTTVLESQEASRNRGENLRVHRFMTLLNARQALRDVQHEVEQVSLVVLFREMPASPADG